MAKKNKFYVVWQGHTPGIYHSWNECKRQITNFPNAIYKSFTCELTAQEAFRSPPEQYIGQPEKDNSLSPQELLKIGTPIIPSISVDAACSGNPGIMEYKGVETDTKALIFHQGPYPQATVNIGEFLAIVHALAYMKKNNISLPVYSDSKTAITWVMRKHCNTKLPQNQSNAKIFNLIYRAEQWLKANQWDMPIIKWETKAWGEIPADFGRK